MHQFCLWCTAVHGCNVLHPIWFTFPLDGEETLRMCSIAMMNIIIQLVQKKMNLPSFSIQFLHCCWWSSTRNDGQQCTAKKIDAFQIAIFSTATYVFPTSLWKKNQLDALNPKINFLEIRKKCSHGMTDTMISNTTFSFFIVQYTWSFQISKDNSDQLLKML